MRPLIEQLQNGGNFKNPLDAFSVGAKIHNSLELPEHLRETTILASALKKVASFKTQSAYTTSNPGKQEELLESFIWKSGEVSDEEVEALEDYKDTLKARICSDEDVLKYSPFLLDLVDKGVMHNYLFVGEGGYGKVILVFNYSRTPTRATIIKLGKNPTQRVGGVGNLIDEAEGQERFYNFYREHNSKNSTIEIKVPHLFCNSRYDISSSPDQGHLAMEYTNAETIEMLLYIGDFIDDPVFKDISGSLKKMEESDDVYFSTILLPKFASMGVDYKKAIPSTIIRLLTKKDLIYILNYFGKNVNPKGNKRLFNKEVLKRALGVFFSLNGEELTNIEALTSLVFSEYNDFLNKAKTKGLEHKDLNTSNIMIDYKDGRVLLWLIDFGTTAAKKVE